MNTMIRILLLLLLTSCALFQKGPDLRKLPVDSLLDSLTLTGEGRGRLEVDNRSYVFSLEAAYSEEVDQWGLSASFPVYGEEVLIYKKIKTAKITQVQNFEKRLLESMPREWHREFQETSRKIVRFILAKKLSLARTCVQKSDDFFECQVENDTFSVRVHADQILVMKKFTNFSITYSGTNLTDSFFDHTSLTVHSYSAQDLAKQELNLELFWGQIQ